MALTGSVQFKYGRSLHKVDLTYIKGTTVMPSGAEKKQGTFTERYTFHTPLLPFMELSMKMLLKNKILS